MNRPTYDNPPGEGFTLIELLVVVAITAVVLALSFPMIGAMKRDSSASTGRNTVAVAVSVALRYATVSTDFRNGDLDLANTEGNEPGTYSGAAVVFTPAGELRLTRNYSDATFPYSDGDSRYLERRGPGWKEPQFPGQPEKELNGFNDIDIDYVLLPADTAVAGISRHRVNNPTDPPELLPPPFAIWFNQNGYMITTGKNLIRGNRPNDYEFVYYDGNYDGQYAVNGQRADRRRISNYNPDDYNPNTYSYNNNNWHNQRERYILPFEKLEAVIGVYVYSRADFDQAVEDRAIEPWAKTSATDNNVRWQWMKENGEMVLFSKQTGTMIRTRDE